MVHADSYQSDRDLAFRVHTFLAGRHVPDLRNLTVEAHNGTITVRGRVRTFYAKQLTHSCASRVAGVKNVIDAVDVDN